MTKRMIVVHNLLPVSYTWPFSLPPNAWIEKQWLELIFYWFLWKTNYEDVNYVGLSQIKYMLVLAMLNFGVCYRIVLS
jgi:hypothetical protein